MKPPKGTKPLEPDFLFLEDGGTLKKADPASGSSGTAPGAASGGGSEVRRDKSRHPLDEGLASAAEVMIIPSSLEEGEDVTKKAIPNPLLGSDLTEKTPVTHPIDLRTIHQQLEDLTKLIYETRNCRVTITSNGDGNPSQVRFQTNNNGRISRGKGTHAAAIPALAFALGNKYYEGKRSLDSGGELPIGPYEFCVNIGQSKDLTQPDGHDLTLFITDIRDLLLEHEIGRFFVSAQNAQYFLRHKTRHPVSGKGATNADNCCIPIEKLLDDEEFSLEVETDFSDPSKTIINIICDESISEPMVQEFRERFDVETEVIKVERREGSPSVFKIRADTPKLLSEMLFRKTNYQGLIVYNGDGEILAAMRKNPGQAHILGYGTSGGHCSDPYHPRLHAVADAGGEFGLVPATDFNASDVRFLSKVDKDVRVYTMSDEKMLRLSDIEASAAGGPSSGAGEAGSSKPSSSIKLFDASADEFLPGTEASLSFQEIRERNLPLRNIPSIELYLGWQEKLLRDSLTKKDHYGQTQVWVMEDCNPVRFGTTKFPKNTFGKIRFLSTKTDDFKAYLEDLLGGEVEVVTDPVSRNTYLDVVDLNPQQVLDAFEGIKTKADFEEYRARQARKDLERSSAAKIQDLVKLHRINSSPFLTKSVSVDEGATSAADDERAQMTMKEVSARNLNALRSRLLDGGFLPPEEKKLLLEEKEDDKLFTEVERTLLRNVLRFFEKAKISFCTNSRGGVAVESAREILSTRELVRKSMIREEGEIPDYKETRMGENVFSTVGSKSAISPYFSRSGYGMMYRFGLQEIFADKKATSSAWIGPNVIRLLYGNSQLNAVTIGNRSLRITHNTVPKGTKPRTKTYAIYDNTLKKTIMSYDVDLEDEISYGKDIMRFLSYTFIERLRYLGGDTRDHLLSNPGDEKALELAVDQLLAPDYNYALHFPAKLPLPDIVDVHNYRECISIGKETSRYLMNYDDGFLKHLLDSFTPEVLLYSFSVYSKATGQDCFVKAVDKAASKLVEVADSETESEGPKQRQVIVPGKLDRTPVIDWLVRYKFANEFAAKQRMSKTLLPETLELLHILNKSGSGESLKKLARSGIIDVGKIQERFVDPKTRTPEVLYLGSWVMRELNIPLPDLIPKTGTRGAASGGGGAGIYDREPTETADEVYHTRARKYKVGEESPSTEPNFTVLDLTEKRTKDREKEGKDKQ